MSVEGSDPEMADAPQEEDVPIEGTGAGAVAQDEGVNTIEDGANEPDVIGTYTETQPEDLEEFTGQQESQEQAEEPTGDVPASGEEPAGGSRPPSATPPAGSRPGSSAAPAPPSRSGSIQAQPEAVVEASRPSSAVPQGSRPGSAEPAAETAPAGSRPASALGGEAAPTGSRPASALRGDAPGAGSRPASALAAEAPAAGSRPASALGGEAAPAGSRPASALGGEAAPTGSRPASALAAEASAAAGSRPASALAAEAPAAGSRPASALGGEAAPTGSRPASALAAEAPAAAGSRPGSALGGDAPAAGSRPASALGGEAAPTGSRPASALAAEAPAAGSRPASALAAEAPAPGSRPASALGGDAPAAGSRPVSGAITLPAVVNSRPGSSQSVAAPTAPDAKPPSRPPSQPAAAPAPGSRPASVSASAPGTAAQASGSSRPTSALTPGAEAADARPSSALLKAQAAEEADFAIPGMRGIDVAVEQGPGLPNRMLRVYLDYTQTDTKSYLGGYRNKRTGAVYHHACTQTPKAPKYAGAEPKLERQTQTVKVSTRSQQAVREASTQMERPGVTLDTTHDRVMTPGRYQTSEERLAIVTDATRTVQRWMRGYFGRKRAMYLWSKKMERESFLQEQEMKAQQAAEEHRRREIERRMHPRTAADFEILYNELEAWRLQETRKIKEAGLSPDKEQEVLQQLLHKETKLLQTIDRLKINANHENKDTRIQHTLGDMSKPKQYELKNGKKVEVHTPFTTRAKELMQLYNGLNLPMLTIDERLDVLLHVKWTVKEFDCNLTREVVALIDREADLLNRGRSPFMLEGLRKRIASMFLNFIETPEFNPEAARYQVVPMDFERYIFERLEKSTSPAVTVHTKTSKWDA